jgi:hypothetical protein
MSVDNYFDRRAWRSRLTRSCLSHAVALTIHSSHKIELKATKSLRDNEGTPQ